LERNQLIAIVVIIVVVAGAGVALYYFSLPTRPPEDTLIWETIGNPDYLDPHIDYESFGSYITQQVYEYLYFYPFGSSTTDPTVPMLAAAAPVWNEELTSVNITLRQGIKFHDGTPFNASCVKWNFERAMKIFYPDGPIWMFAEPILGGVALEDIAFDEGPSSTEFATAFDDWVANSGAMVVLDTYKIQFNLVEPFVPFIPAITYAVPMMSPSFAIANGEHDTSPGDMTNYGCDYGEWDTYMVEHTCGTGPYEVVEWIKNQHVYMTLNEDYWRADTTRTDLTAPTDVRPPNYAGSLKHVYLKTNDDATTRILNLRAGTVDGAYLAEPQSPDLWEWDTPTTGHSLYPDDIVISTGGGSFYVEHFGFNHKIVYNVGPQSLNLTSPFDNRDARLAFIYAFNHTANLATGVLGFGEQAQGVIPRGLWGHQDDLPMYSQNMTASVEHWELAMANATTKARFQAFMDNGGMTLFYNTGNLRRETACLVLKDGLLAMHDAATTKLTDFAINVQGLEWSSYLDHGRKRKMSLFIIGWIPDYADADNYLWPYTYHFGAFTYRLGYNNTDVNAWYEAQKAESNATRRMELIRNIEFQVYEDCPMLMVTQRWELRAYRTWLKGESLTWNAMTTSSIGAGYIYHLYKDYPT
jgi:peptide/nickel transport system substrate-binding protein